MNIKEIAKQNNLSQIDLTILNEISNRMFKGYYKIPIREIASASFVSTTSVIRLAKKLGYEGYSELLYALKIDSTTNVDYKASDAIRSIIIEERSLDVIDNFIRDLASGEYERIHVIGIGYSDYIAQYLRDKLLELDYFSTNKSPLDFLNSRKSLILFVSESGETTDLIFIEERCKKMNYKIYALSSTINSTLCKHVKNHIVIKNGKKKNKAPNYFIGNSINLIESVLAILESYLKEEKDD